jgi:hypothetical protein
MSLKLLEKLVNKKITKAELIELVEVDFSLVPALLNCTGSPKAAVRYGCAAVLAELCGKHPDKLYPYFDRFMALLDSKHRIITWNALAAIANLTAADKDNKFDAAFERYYSFLGSEYMVTVANTVGNSATIVKNKPHLADRIAAELLSEIPNLKITPHLTEECKLVIAEKALQAFNTIIKYAENKQAIVDFAKMHQNSSRASLRKEAQNFLVKWNKTAC